MKTAIRYANAAEWHDSLGNVPLERILFDPWPGSATEADLVARVEKKDFCELVHGTLIQKPPDFRKSLIGVSVICALGAFAKSALRGFIVGPAVPFRFLPGVVLLPDVSFTLPQTLPRGRIPRESVVPFAPDLTVDICCPGITSNEIERRIRHYFNGGTQLAWVITQDPRGRVYYGPKNFTVIDGNGALVGGDILPGLRVPLTEAYQQLKSLTSASPPASHS